MLFREIHKKNSATFTSGSRCIQDQVHAGAVTRMKYDSRLQGIGCYALVGANFTSIGLLMTYSLVPHFQF
jgi:hypothetical protein